MLVLSRKKNESIIINDNITVTVIEIRGDKVRLGIEAPKDVTVHRREVLRCHSEPGSRSRFGNQGSSTGCLRSLVPSPVEQANHDAPVGSIFRSNLCTHHVLVFSPPRYGSPRLPAGMSF